MRALSLITWQHCSPFHHVCFTPSPPSLCVEAFSQLAGVWPATAILSHYVTESRKKKNSCSNFTLVNRLNSATRNRAPFLCRSLNWLTTGGSSVPPSPAPFYFFLFPISSWSVQWTEDPLPLFLESTNEVIWFLQQHDCCSLRKHRKN